MSSKRRLRRNECTGKKKLSQSVASQTAGMMSRLSGHRISQYRCRWCKMWHIGHTPSSITKRIY